MLIWMPKDIKRGLQSINEKATAKQEIMHEFTEIIQFHYDAKQLSERYSFWKSNSIHAHFNCPFVFCLYQYFPNLTLFRLTKYFWKPLQPILIAYFSYSTFAICVSLLLVQMELVEYFICEN